MAIPRSGSGRPWNGAQGKCSWASFAQLLDTTGLGIVQLDGRERIVAANDRARDMLRGGDGLFDEDGFLCARRPEDNADLQGLLTRALPPFGAQGAGGSMMMKRSAALPPLVLHVNPVGRQETDYHLWPVAALVLVVDPASHIRIDPAVAAAALGLTGMESRVAVLLAEGMNVREIAAATGRGESTIRSPCEANVCQARPVTASGAGTACAVVGRRSGVPALKAGAAAGWC